MTLQKGEYSISVEKIYGKNPGLWIGTRNGMTKVASFGSADKAEIFCKWLKYLVGIGEEPFTEPPKEDDDESQMDYGL